MSAVHSDLAFVSYPGMGGGCGCNCDCKGTPMVFRSVWDRLIQQLFGATPLGMDSEDQLPDIEIWKDGVELVDGPYPYTFRVMSPAGISPKPYDVVLYKGKYYVIGEVDGSSNESNNESGNSQGTNSGTEQGENPGEVVAHEPGVEEHGGSGNESGGNVIEDGIVEG